MPGDDVDVNVNTVVDAVVVDAVRVGIHRSIGDEDREDAIILLLFGAGCADLDRTGGMNASSSSLPGMLLWLWLWLYVDVVCTLFDSIVILYAVLCCVVASHPRPEKRVRVVVVCLL